MVAEDSSNLVSRDHNKRIEEGEAADRMAKKRRVEENVV